MIWVNNSVRRLRPKRGWRDFKLSSTISITPNIRVFGFVLSDMSEHMAREVIYLNEYDIVLVSLHHFNNTFPIDECNLLINKDGNLVTLEDLGSCMGLFFDG